MKRAICVHGHFYQPPRENPWLDRTELQPSAAPFHDWNERIAVECYRPNGAARILDGHGRIGRIVSNYSRMSFNFGPTLLEWLARERRDVYAAILRADVESRRRFGGHGAAMAQAYNHAILPLCSLRDKRTQVRWGIRDFEHRFGRRPEGMWCPETAADMETLEVLAQEGIAFTVLAPRQAAQTSFTAPDWREVRPGSVDTRRPYRVAVGGGRSIAVFFYDGGTSQAIAFERLLRSGDALAKRLLGAFGDEGESDEPLLVHVATDGETYGHHHAHGEMALAWALDRIERTPDVRLTCYAEYLEAHPPTWDAEIVSPSSWSCAHGVGRWQEDCGCHLGAAPGWNQAWRAPLRRAVDHARDRLGGAYQGEAAALLRDPDGARDDYISVMLSVEEAYAAAVERPPSGPCLFVSEAPTAGSDDGPVASADPVAARRHVDRAIDRFLADHAVTDLAATDRRKVLWLLESQRHALLMQTSCGWFFDDLVGIEATQILQYAARGIELATRAAPGAVDDLESEVLAILAQAKSNTAGAMDGATLYRTRVLPLRRSLASRIAHRVAIAAGAGFGEREIADGTYLALRSLRERGDEARLVTGVLDAGSLRTGTALRWAFASFRSSDESELVVAVEAEDAIEDLEGLEAELDSALHAGDSGKVRRLMLEHYRAAACDGDALTADERRWILRARLQRDADAEDRRSEQRLSLREDLLAAAEQMRIAPPAALQASVAVGLRSVMRCALLADPPDPATARDALERAKRNRISLTDPRLSRATELALAGAVSQWLSGPRDLDRLMLVDELMSVALVLAPELDRFDLQNAVHQVRDDLMVTCREAAATGDELAAAWVGRFASLAVAAGVRV